MIEQITSVGNLSDTERLSESVTAAWERVDEKSWKGGAGVQVVGTCGEGGLGWGDGGSNRNQ